MFFLETHQANASDEKYRVVLFTADDKPSTLAFMTGVQMDPNCDVSFFAGSLVFDRQEAQAIADILNTKTPGRWSVMSAQEVYDLPREP